MYYSGTSETKYNLLDILFLCFRLLFVYYSETNRLNLIFFLCFRQVFVFYSEELIEGAPFHINVADDGQSGFEQRTEISHTYETVPPKDMHLIKHLNGNHGNSTSYSMARGNDDSDNYW